jgi:NAD(P)H-flavin reductase
MELQKTPDAGSHPEPMIPEPFEVRRVIRETHDTTSLVLSPVDGLLPGFSPGQFNMLYAFGIGESAISISGDPARSDRLTHTIRAVGAVTRNLCALKRGDAIGVRGPYGTPWPVEEIEGSDVVIVAGGIGLAPLRPALLAVLANRKRYGSVNLLYGTRTPRDILYEKELRTWRGRFDMDVEVTVDHAAGEPFEHVGVVTQLIPFARFDPTETAALICGPEVMMRFTIQSLIERGVAPERIYLSMERNMKCAIGLCGHCQLGPTFICKDGPVYCYPDLRPFFKIREV